MSNPFIKMLGNRPAYKVLEDELKGVVSNTTLYNLLDEGGIPAKTQWETVVKVSEALGYRIDFVKNDNNIR